jgi:hypothetical protein
VAGIFLLDSDDEVLVIGDGGVGGLGLGIDLGEVIQALEPAFA